MSMGLLCADLCHRGCDSCRRLLLVEMLRGGGGLSVIGSKERGGSRSMRSAKKNPHFYWRGVVCGCVET